MTKSLARANRKMYLLVEKLFENLEGWKSNEICFEAWPTDVPRQHQGA